MDLNKPKDVAGFIELRFLKIRRGCPEREGVSFC